MRTPMPRYRATALQDNSLPWYCWDTTDGGKTRPMEWGVTLVPTPDDPEDPTEWTWSAMLPEGITLPSWIQPIIVNDN
jgi:hypothetical protein